MSTLDPFLDIRDMKKSYGAIRAVDGVSLKVGPGEIVGVIGPNGSGKTTLLRLLLGELPPDSGSIRLGTGLEVAYFDQLREQLDPDRTVFESIADGADWIDVGAGRVDMMFDAVPSLLPLMRLRPVVGVSTVTMSLLLGVTTRREPAWLTRRLATEVKFTLLPSTRT